ncbi:SGNH/GDSL hydrolase family protein [Actinomadura spongiicola]|uniref:SGNH/GDSL hydrolase family protein n=1 Tax=Actinomadura spongiicola TaxID=2303421 RepID=A0A372G6Q0_9ACTN|nr:SGNH/GDSL hydrolase family protein [Actinomadura spongiicola]RFS81046.1 SGNH/GDSL hydrolase family protein [Actinomadura spongiicola]
MTSRRARRGAATLVLCLVLVATLSATGCSVFQGSVQRSAAADGPGQGDGPERRRGPSMVMFLGDSYTVGDRGLDPEATFASATARLLGWQVVAAGRAGAGFVNKSAGAAYLGLFEGQLGWRPAPDLLIVSGGHNDWRVPAPQVAAAAHLVLDRAKRRWPGTHIVLMGPLWGSGEPTPGAVAVRNALKHLAGQLAVPFVDPIGERWITGTRKARTGNAFRFIKRDGTHPTPAGHRYMATRLVSDLQRLGLDRPVRKD